MPRPLLGILIYLLLVLLSPQIQAADPWVTLPVWPGTVPGERGEVGAEQILPPREGETPVQRVTNVTQPTISVYRPAPEKSNGTAVVICPGGGYQILAFDKEGTEVAEWLNSLGVTAVVLKYRVPRRADQPKHLAPLQDAQRAIRLVRQHAAEWNLAVDRIGLLGFSAGGHLSAVAATNFDQTYYVPVDEADKLSCRPDFVVLIYPAYLVEAGKLNAEVRVGAQTPPMFFVHAGNDRIGPENSIGMYLALKAVDVPAELHVFTSGGHGFGLRPSADPVSKWPQQCADWLLNGGWIGPNVRGPQR